MTSNHRAAKWPPADFDRHSALQFSLLVSLGLREYHSVLDAGCGSLGLGRLLIAYLSAGRYHGMESQQSPIEAGVQFEVGHDAIDLKNPGLLVSPYFEFQEFGATFDFIVADAVLQVSPDILPEAAKCLRPDGLLLASWLLDAENSERKLRTEAAAAGLVCKPLDWAHPASLTWFVYTRPGCQSVPEDPVPLFHGPPYANVSQLEIASDFHAGYVDSVEDVGNYLYAKGWALDPLALRPARQVLFAGPDGRIFISGSANSPRADLIPRFGPGSLLSGFRVLLPKALLANSTTVFCYALNRGAERAYLLPGALADIFDSLRSH